MFGIGGGELLFILLVVLMLFGSDKIPEIARTLGKTMAQLKNATNDIKSEIQKGAQDNGLDTKSFTNSISSITQEIDKAKEELLSGAISDSKEIQQEIEEATGPIKRSK